jgi:hypothetical protein
LIIFNAISIFIGYLKIQHLLSEVSIDKNSAYSSLFSIKDWNIHYSIFHESSEQILTLSSTTGEFLPGNIILIAIIAKVSAVVLKGGFCFNQNFRVETTIF